MKASECEASFRANLGLEVPECKASFRSNSSFLGLAGLPPKKRASEKGKAVSYEPLERNSFRRLDLNLSETLSFFETTPENDPQGKILFDKAPPKADVKPAEIPQKDQQSLRKGEKGESFKHPSVGFPSPPPTRNPMVCKFCGRKFSTSHALGGHQNAHKKERETIQRAMKAAQAYAASPFIYRSPATVRAPDLFHHGHYFHYSPYQRGWQFMRPSSLQQIVNPVYDHGWPRSYFRAPNPIQSPRVASTFLQVKENEDGLAKKQCVGSIGLDLSFNNKRNKSSELDLTFKL